MWTPRLIESARMKYLGIVEALDADIRSGVVVAGQRLPPQRTIAELLGVDLTTVTRACNEARRRGLVEAQPGRGTFIREVVEGAAPQASPLIDLSMNIPPQAEGIDFSRFIPQGITAVLATPKGLLSLQYQESTGTEPDRQAAASWLSARVNTVTSDRIVVTGGAQGALFAICDMLLHRGDVIATGSMTYPGLKAVAFQKGLLLEPLAMDNEGVLPDALDALCRRAPPKAVYLIPSIDNPTTATLPHARRVALVEIARKHGIVIIEDDPYSPLRSEQTVSIAALAPEITWHIATLSKCATPALRIAYVVAPSVTGALRLAGTLRATMLMAPPLLSALASRWISDGTLNGITQAIRAENVERQKLAASIFGEIGYAADPHGHHLWLRLPRYWRADDFAQHADRAGVAIVPSAAFSTATQPVEAVRISLGVALERGDLEDGLTQLVHLIDQPSIGIRAVV